MSTAKTVITFAVLDAALGGLVSGAKGTPVEDGLNNFKNLFNSFRESTPVIKDLTPELTQAKEIIAELKQKNAELTEEKAASTPKNVIEINKVKHVVNHGAYPHSVEDIVSNPELAKEILKIAGQKAISKL